MVSTPMASQASAPYPVVRMCFNIFLLLTLGSLTSFSIWSFKLRETFPSWTAHELQLVYSAGLFGAWSQPLGGLFYDNFGSRKTKMMGTTLVVLGFFCMSMCTQYLYTSPALVAFLYFLEEQGAATLQVSITCDAFKHFPSNSMGVTMGLCTFGFAASGFLWTAVLGVCSSLPLPAIFSIVGGSIVTCVLPQLLYSSRQTSLDEAPPKPSLAKYRKALLSRPFFVIWGVAVFLRSPTWLIFGLLKDRGMAAGINGVALVGACLAVNTFVRLPMGWAWDFWSSRRPGVSLRKLLTGLTLLFGVGASLLVADALKTNGALVWIGCLMCSSMFGCVAPLANVWVRDNFEPEVRGGVFGAHSISISIGNLGITALVGPSSTATSKDFLSMSVAILVANVTLFAILALTSEKKAADLTAPACLAPPCSHEQDVELHPNDKV
mmetsp:Transcript_101373/g.180205  ORF Transcript_101373/g.180205 Transcript_101373/m.180205 type:complete len:436 (+) Transcript_101373:60-1367(+)|eukprot:CAMPEP_0197660474 /NCGR_PEP_ID=MMETSP1338-20131121/50866_1 /TAXON_ID=43686 ORGANISM="Pelagodinium beii, Strain RCC1491" /NCGR_SAMPLE_ID=MMETSP1338 /ASSEMBLY_ACC=CAM_ASM_000754 /LENGTH=435 /DNA_ID=CAMNT_0043237829 /DNA_START=60 /DNA_END=1367 /DNA_ORIENTATION=+